MQLLRRGIIYFFLLLGIIAASYGLYALYQKTQSAILIAAILYVINVVFALSLFAQERHNQAKVSWLIMMLVAPFFGHLIFYIFGQRYSGRMSFAKYLQKPTFAYEQINESTDELINKVARISHRHVHESALHLYYYGDEAFEELFASLRKAQRYIFLQYYIIKPGVVFTTLKTILLDRAAKGVEIRLIIDDFGQWGMPWYEMKALRDAGIKIAVFGKVDFPFVGAMNAYRSHRKVTIIDGEVLYTGGANIADEYISYNKHYGVWLDSHIKVTGPVINSFLLLYIEDWALITKQSIDPAAYLSGQTKPSLQGASEVVLLEDSPEIKEDVLQGALVLLIASAKKSITIVTPYLVPTPEIDSALRTALRAGIKVTLHVPGKPDKRSVYVGTRIFAGEYAKLGAKIYEQKDMFIHSKFGVIDEEYVYLGAANMDIRSMYSQFEILILARGAIVKEALAVLAKYELTAREVNLAAFEASRLSQLWRRLYVTLLAPLF